MKRLTTTLPLLALTLLTLASTAQANQPQLEWYYGMQVQPARDYNGHVVGARVYSVRQGSPAYRAGLRRGDVIHSAGRFNFRKAHNTRCCIHILQKAAGDQDAPMPTVVTTNQGGSSVAMTVERNGRYRQRFVYPEYNGGDAPAPTAQSRRR